MSCVLKLKEQPVRTYRCFFPILSLLLMSLIKREKMYFQASEDAWKGLLYEPCVLFLGKKNIFLLLGFEGGVWNKRIPLHVSISTSRGKFVWRDMQKNPTKKLRSEFCFPFDIYLVRLDLDLEKKNWILSISVIIFTWEFI